MCIRVPVYVYFSFHTQLDALIIKQFKSDHGLMRLCFFNHFIALYQWCVSAGRSVMRL